MNRTTRLQHLVGAVSQAVPAVPVSSAIVETAKQKPGAMAMLTHEVLPGLAVGGLGAFLWKRHRVLGFFAGTAVGMNAYPLVKGESRVSHLCNVGVAAAGVGTSLYWKKHPVLGYLGGVLGAGILTLPLRGSK